MHRLFQSWVNSHMQSSNMDSLFEDDQLLVINKPTGFIVEGPPKDGQKSLTTLLISQLKKPIYPCHRLDKDTTGVLLFAKSKRTLTLISELFAKRKVRKTYLACVDGEWDLRWNKVETKIKRSSDQRMINSIEGKYSMTTFRRLANWNNKSLLEALPKTGRTHQIRLHCLFHNCPISGDSLYSNPSENNTPMALHAWQLRFNHPISKEALNLKAPLPDYWQNHWLKDCPFEIR